MTKVDQEIATTDHQVINPDELSDEALDELISESVTTQAWGWPCG